MFFFAYRAVNRLYWNGNPEGRRYEDELSEYGTHYYRRDTNHAGIYNHILNS